MPNKDRQLKILLDDATYAKLEKLKNDTRGSMGAIIRDLIEWRFAMQCEGRPTCANGRACFVAAMHVFAQPTATIVTEVKPHDIPRLVNPMAAVNG